MMASRAWIEVFFIAPHHPGAWRWRGGVQRRARVRNVVGSWICCHIRERHERSRSVRNQRPNVLDETAQSGKAVATRRASSARLQRANGTFCWRGN